jgi:hypothetical protein
MMGYAGENRNQLLHSSFMIIGYFNYRKLPTNQPPFRCITMRKVMGLMDGWLVKNYAIHVIFCSS